MTRSERLQSADWLTLTDGEQIEWHGRPSLFRIAPQVAGALLVAIGGAVAVSLLTSLVGAIPTVVHLVPFLIGGGLLTVVVLQWYRVQYVITSQQVYIKRGFLSLDVDQIRIGRIQNTTLSQSLLERLLGYGDVIAYTAGSDTLNIEFESVPDPSGVNRTLSELLGQPETEPPRCRRGHIFFARADCTVGMQLIVVGYGRVGSRTARVLAEEGYDVVVVDTNHQKVERAREQGLQVVEGDGTDEEILKEAGIESADALGGITGDVEINHKICLLGNEHGCRTVLRISEDVSTDVYETYLTDADEVIYPQRLGAAGAKTALLGGSLNAIGDLTERLQLTVLTVDHDSPIVGSRISEIELPDTARLYAHGRKRDPMTIPLPTTTIETGDRLALVVEQQTVDELRSLLLGDE